MNKVPLSSGSMIVLFERERGRGMRSTISMSNTRKMTASKKKRREKGSRADLFGSNPHSKGDFFSRSSSLRMVRAKITRRSMSGIKMASMQEI